MSDQNKAILIQANAALVKGDIEGFLAHCTEDVEWLFVGDQTLAGKDAVRRYMQATYAGPPKFAVSHLIAEGDYITALGHITLRDEDRGDVQAEYCDVWRVRGGQLAQLRAFVIPVRRGD